MKEVFLFALFRAIGGQTVTVRALFRVIDWMMDLPEAVAIVFDSELRKIEQEFHMPYVTSVERRAIEQGFEQGLVAGQVQLLRRLLGTTESTLPELTTQSLEALRAEVEQLEQELALRRLGE